MNKNVRNGDVVNRTGTPGDVSFIVDCESEDFYDNIEPLIVDTVKELRRQGYQTASSCQGHDYPGLTMRKVVVIDNKDVIDNLEKRIKELNRLYSDPIGMEKTNNDSLIELYPKKFEDPYILRILFGPFFDTQTARKQHVFNIMIHEGAFDK